MGPRGERDDECLLVHVYLYHQLSSLDRQALQMVIPATLGSTAFLADPMALVGGPRSFALLPSMARSARLTHRPR